MASFNGLASTRGLGTMQINGRKIGPGEPTYIIAEMSCNHNNDIEEGVSFECGDPPYAYKRMRLQR